MRQLKQGTILLINTVLIIFFIAVRIFISLVPNDAQRLKEKQEKWSRNGESPYDNRWAYFLINNDSPLPEDYEVPLDAVQGTFLMDARCARYAREMLAAAEEDGVHLMVVSAYRSKEKQQLNLEAYTERLISEGHSETEARALALREIAEPGTSEHNAGLALDILTEDWWETHDDVTADFENTEEYLWLSAHAYEYGFILRYPKKWEDVTGYIYEPWHFRFVGLKHAKEMKLSGLPLEYSYKNTELIGKVNEEEIIIDE